MRKLQNLTSAMKLDYYKFMSDYDQTAYYAARQLEAGLQDCTPQIMLVRRGRRGKGKI